MPRSFLGKLHNAKYFYRLIVFYIFLVNVGWWKMERERGDRQTDRQTVEYDRKRVGEGEKEKERGMEGES